jgi:hypothetical protein
MICATQFLGRNTRNARIEKGRVGFVEPMLAMAIMMLPEGAARLGGCPTCYSALPRRESL